MKSKRPPEPSETMVLNQVLHYLAYDARVHRAWRVNSGAVVFNVEGGRKRFVKFNGAGGHSDIAGVLVGGRALFMEVKRPSGRLTDKQRGFLADMQASGALAGVVRSVTDAQALIEQALAQEAA